MSNISDLVQSTNAVNDASKKQGVKTLGAVPNDDNFRQMINLIHSNNMQDVVPTLPLEDIQLISQIIELAKKIKTTQYPVQQAPTGPNEIKYVYVKTNVETSGTGGISNLQRYVNAQNATAQPE